MAGAADLGVRRVSHLGGNNTPWQSNCSADVVMSVTLLLVYSGCSGGQLLVFERHEFVAMVL